MNNEIEVTRSTYNRMIQRMLKSKMAINDIHEAIYGDWLQPKSMEMIFEDERLDSDTKLMFGNKIEQSNRKGKL